MATYTELFGFYGTPDFDDLRNKVKVALIVKAADIVELPSPTSAQIEWAKSAIASPGILATQVINYVLAVNNQLDISTIIGASDTAIQNNVDSAVDNLFAV